MELMDPVEFRSLTHDEDGKMWYQRQLFSGIAVDYWPNGQLASEEHYIDGLQDGWSRGWHENGVLSVETLFRKGRATGLHRKWNPNGQLKSEEEIEQGIRLWSKEWNEDGRLLKDYVLTSDHPQYKLLQLMRQQEKSDESPK